MLKLLFDQLYEAYHQDLYQYIIYMVKDRTVAEDLIQEVYIKVLRSYDSFDGRSSEKTWLFSIAKHVTIDYFRKQKRKRNRIMEFFDWGEKGEKLQDYQPLPDEVSIQNEEMQQIYKALDHCTVDQKNVIVLRFIQEMSIREAAEILNWTESKVKTTQYRGLKMMRKYLEDLSEGGVQREA